MNAVPFDSNSMNSIRRGRAFSMTELLVVIAIIAVLAGLLLVALRGVRVRALATSTQSTMQQFSRACDSFQIDHGSYPGIVPEGILAANPVISGTENALLHMMGGVVRGDHPNYDDFLPADGWLEIVIDNNTNLGKIKVNKQLIGNGPEINGKPYSPYFTPKGDELTAIAGQAGSGGIGIGTIGPLPDLVGAWGQPIIYVRRSRTVGPLVGEDTDVPKPQFMLGTMRPYIDSVGLAEFGRNQQDQAKGSILYLAGNDASATFAQIIRHASFGEPDEPLTGTARGAYVLISAGKDGVYFSVADGPGTPTTPVYNIFDDQVYGNPQVVEEYDDIRLFGGG